MRIHPILVITAFLPHLVYSANTIRCQCSRAYSGIPCYNNWCEVRSNATHIAACAVAKKNGSNSNSQVLACALVTERADEGKCLYDVKRNFTKCWCTHGDYCNVDLVDRIRDKRDDEEDDYDGFSVETNTEFNENNNDIGSDEDVEDSQEFRAGSPVAPERIDAVDMRKPVETRYPDSAEQAIAPWRRMNPLNGDSAWKPPPPPPMPGKHPILPPTTTSTTTTTTTTTTTAPPTTTTLSYEERMRQYEERRRQIEMQREAELKRREEMERQRMEERRHLESQHEQRRRFGEETRSWPAAPVAPVENPTTTTTTTRTTPTTTSTTTTTTPTITTTTTTSTTTAPPTTTTTTTPRPTTTKVKEEKNYDAYYRNWKQHRRPLDLNPTQVSIQSVSAIVYPPKNFVKATTSTLPPTTTTTTQETTTTTQPIIYPPANFRKATKGSSTTTTTTTTTTTKAPRTTTSTEKAYTLPVNDDDDYDDEEDDAVPYETDRKMVEMPKIESDEVESVVMYTPRPPQNRPSPPPTPSVRTPAEKLDEYKKLLAAEEEPSSSASSIILSSFISIIIFFLL